MDERVRTGTVEGEGHTHAHRACHSVTIVRGAALGTLRTLAHWVAASDSSQPAQPAV
jgi:hypothetical protein